jgi:hypothetical protein
MKSISRWTAAHPMRRQPNRWYNTFTVTMFLFTTSQSCTTPFYKGLTYRRWTRIISKGRGISLEVTAGHEAVSERARKACCCQEGQLSEDIHTSVMQCNANRVEILRDSIKPLQCSRYSDWLGAGRQRRSEFESWQEQVFLPYRLDRLWGPHCLLSNGYLGSLPVAKEAWPWTWPLTFT